MWNLSLNHPESFRLRGKGGSSFEKSNQHEEGLIAVGGNPQGAQGAIVGARILQLYDQHKHV